MNRLLLPAAGLAALVAGPALAQPGLSSAGMTVVGAAPQICALSTLANTVSANVNFDGLSGSTLRLTALTDPVTLSTAAASTEIQFQGVCNFAHRLKLESQNNGLWRDSALTPDGFGTAVPYRASLRWGALDSSVEMDASSRQIKETPFNINQAVAGDLTLRLDIQRGATNAQDNAPLAAGVYQETLRITVEPQ